MRGSQLGAAYVRIVQARAKRNARSGERPKIHRVDIRREILRTLGKIRALRERRPDKDEKKETQAQAHRLPPVDYHGAACDYVPIERSCQELFGPNAVLDKDFGLVRAGSFAALAAIFQEYVEHKEDDRKIANQESTAEEGDSAK